jgi:hypothetical protein
MVRGNPEYLRRNLLVCNAVGANANARAALNRLLVTRRPAKWMVAYLKGIIERTEPLVPALVSYREEIPGPGIVRSATNQEAKP